MSLDPTQSDSSTNSLTSSVSPSPSTSHPHPSSMTDTRHQERIPLSCPFASMRDWAVEKSSTSTSLSSNPFIVNNNNSNPESSQNKPLSRPSRGLHLSRSPQDLMIPVSVFCKAFPFHFLCDSQLRLLQIGSGTSTFISIFLFLIVLYPGLMRILGKNQASPRFLGSHIRSFFVIEQPSLTELSFDSILGKTNVCFIIRNIVPSHKVHSQQQQSTVTMSTSPSRVSMGSESVSISSSSSAPSLTAMEAAAKKGSKSMSKVIDSTSTSTSCRRISQTQVNVSFNDF